MIGPGLRRDLLRLYLIGAAGLAIVIPIGVVLMRRANADCLPTVRQRLLAPDSVSEAVIWGYDCGWATKGVASLGVGQPGASPKELAHATAVMNTNAIRLITGRARPPRLEAHWEGVDSLFVRYDSHAKMLGHNPAAHGIVLEYDALP
jgi:hypothetical protein